MGQYFLNFTLTICFLLAGMYSAFSAAEQDSGGLGIAAAFLLFMAAVLGKDTVGKRY